MVRHFNHRRKQTAQSPQDSFAYNENLQHQTSQPQHGSLLIKILLFLITEILTCSKVIRTFKRQNQWTDPIRKSSTSFSLSLTWKVRSKDLKFLKHNLSSYTSEKCRSFFNFIQKCSLLLSVLRGKTELQFSCLPLNLPLRELGDTLLPATDLIYNNNFYQSLNKMSERLKISLF